MTDKKEEPPREKIKFWLSVILSTIVSVLGLAYLASIPFGWLGTNRFGTTEAIIFAAILFFNSVLIGKLERLSFNAQGFDMRLARVSEK
ncbi:MAG TPA: hypothetical protein VGW32_03070, partial [Pyrinomonadaceae bacterium]|nr:hypothetical protein [Pyrinomonadaceae bacterium]